MAHSYIANYMHCVFSTKERRKTIKTEMKDRLWAYMGGIAKENRMVALAINGTDNHAHMLLSLPATICVAEALKYIKGGSSLWVHDTFDDSSPFNWQEGYAAFSVSVSRIDETIAYIKSQDIHHRRISFEEEFKKLLDKHGVKYDMRCIFG